jgi:hypothetical protein
MEFTPHEEFTGVLAMQMVEALNGSVDPPETTADLLDQHGFAKEAHGEVFKQIDVVPLLMRMQRMVFPPLDQGRPPRELEESPAQVVGLALLVNLQGVQRLDQTLIGSVG